MVSKYKNEKFVRLDYEEISPKEVFEISNYGRIRSFRTNKVEGKIIKGSYISGYNTVQVKLRDGRMKSYFVHKLVAKFFIDNPHNKSFVTHIDYDIKNNYYLNLVWATRQELSNHRKLDPDYNQKKVRNSKLTEENVKAIWRRLNKLDKPTRFDFEKLARKNNITITQIRRIYNGENWSHLKP